MRILLKIDIKSIDSEGIPYYSYLNNEDIFRYLIVTKQKGKVETTP